MKIEEGYIKLAEREEVIGEVSAVTQGGEGKYTSHEYVLKLENGEEGKHIGKLISYEGNAIPPLYSVGDRLTLQSRRCGRFVYIQAEPIQSS